MKRSIWRRTLGVLLLVALNAGWSHASAPTAAAALCDTYYCAYVSLFISGTGHGHVYDDQGNLDCYYNNGSYTGTCTNVEYYWIGQSNEVLQIKITGTAKSDSWMSGPNGASGIGTSQSHFLNLSRYGHYDEGAFSFYPGSHLTATLSLGGDGDGNVTSSPAGMNCHYAGGVATGTCDTGWWFKDSITVTYSFTPAQDDQGCSGTPPPGDTCGAVNQVKTVTFTESAGIHVTTYGGFRKGHPILTVGVSGSGSVTSLPAGIDCPSTCSKYIPASSLVSLQAASNAGYFFAGWSGACSGTVTICNLSPSVDTNVTATFAKLATPPPTAPPTAPPTQVPGPTPSAHPGSTPGPTVTAPTPGPTAAPGVTPGPGATPGPTLPPGATADPAASVDPNGSSGRGEATTAPGSTDGVAVGAGAGAPGASSAADAGDGQPAVARPDDQGILILIIVVLTLVIGLLLGGLVIRYAMARRRVDPDEPA